MTQLQESPERSFKLPADAGPTCSSTESTVEIKSLLKKYGKTAVVDNLDLSIERGTVYGLIGPNGAGKSTTLKILMRMLKSDSGQVSIFGHDIRTDFDQIKHRIGFVPESHYVYPWMKIEQVIRFTKSYYPNWNDGLTQQLLDLFRLDRKKKVKQLSKGMLAKLALLLAISHEPDLLLLDEPLNGLDPIVREEFMDGVLKTICERETTVVFSSHLMDDVQRVANKIGIIHDGRMLADMAVDDLLASTKRLHVVCDGEQELDWLPKSTICTKKRLGREILVSVNDFSPILLEEFRTKNPTTRISVEDVSLEDAFKDYIRGNRNQSKNGGGPKSA